MEERRRRGISWIGERVAVAVSVMGFGSVVESYSCANPISGLLRVYFSHTRRADRGIERGSLSRASRSPRDRYRSLFLAINDRPACPVYFIRASLFLSPFLLARNLNRRFSPIFPVYILCSKIRSNGADLAALRSTYLPTYTSPRSPSLFFSPRHIFLRSSPTRMQIGAGKGTTVDSSRVYRRGFVRLFAYCLPAEHRAVRSTSR